MGADRVLFFDSRFEIFALQQLLQSDAAIQTDVVGSTPSFTRKGRSSASFSRSSLSLMICAEPCFNNARASSGCMIRSQNSAPASAGRALLVFVQQLAHLLDRERLVVSVERLL